MRGLECEQLIDLRVALSLWIVSLQPIKKMRLLFSSLQSDAARQEAPLKKLCSRRAKNRVIHQQTVLPHIDQGGTGIVAGIYLYI